MLNKVREHCNTGSKNTLRGCGSSDDSERKIKELLAKIEKLERKSGHC